MPPPSLLRYGLLAASRNRTLRALAVKQGMRFGAARFVAGTTLDAFVAEARKQNEGGLRVAAGFLGEGTRDGADARRVATDFIAIVERIRAEGLDANVALKLSHLGLDVSFDEAERNVERVVRAAARLEGFIRIDMEESTRVADTLRTYRRLRAAGFAGVGVVLQARLRRSAADLAALASLSPNIRLVKGAYLERAPVAYVAQPEIDAAYLRLIEAALATVPFVAVATHDGRIIEQTIAFARTHGIAPAGRFEFQMLLGVRTPLARELVDRGYPVRLSVPFGADWYPYLMRRMAENPKNLALLLRNW